MSPRLTLRSANAGDRDLLLAWRNEPAAVAASRSGSVTAEEHEVWFARALDDPDRHLLVAELDGEPAGQVRFDRLRAYRYEISVSVKPEARGEGLGSRLIAGASEWLWGATNASEIEAVVRTENASSRAAFERAGYLLRDGGEAGFVILELRRPEPFTPERPIDRERKLPFS